VDVDHEVDFRAYPVADRRDDVQDRPVRQPQVKLQRAVSEAYQFRRLIGHPPGIGAAKSGIDFDLVAITAAQQLEYGLAERLAYDVPQCLIHP
jgi:hypothetical protein